MQPVIYDVAVSIDGYISGPDGDISGFAQDGPVVEDYLARLAEYRVAIMGRATYEVGYRFGLKPGDNPYEHMKTFVFSLSIDLPSDSRVTKQDAFDPAFLDGLRTSYGGPVYLCGGGAFAASLLARGFIDILRLKRAPILLGGGVRLFEHPGTAAKLAHIRTTPYDQGYLLQEFRVLR